MPRVPEPQYIHETVVGTVFDVPEGTTLVVGQAPPSFVSYAPRLSGTLVLRYGLSLQTPATQAILPGLFVSEKGVALVGEEAWTFMLKHFQMYPRADIVGLRALTGMSLQVFLRELDFGAGVRVFAYESVDVSLPPAEISRLLLGEGAAALPPLLGKYLTPVSMAG
jgi:hypothetical protein